MIVCYFNPNSDTECRLVISKSLIVEIKEQDALGAPRWGRAPDVLQTHEVLCRLLTVAIGSVLAPVHKGDGLYEMKLGMVRL